MNVIISGLTAAGKTTHCSLLNRRFNLERIAAADVFARLSGIGFDVDSTSPRFWACEQGEELTRMRKGSRTIDSAVDAELHKLAATSNHVVFDSWALPWTSKKPALRIWIESSLESRLWKAWVSHGKRGASDRRRISDLVSKKDQQARETFLEMHGFDICRDRDVFDLVLDIGSFISEPTVRAAERSIRRADEIIRNFVGWHIEKKEAWHRALQRNLKAYGPGVFRRVRQ
jgi:cytidylate kinase